jgi:hypothetical protein
MTPERRHFAGLRGPHGQSRQHAGALACRRSVLGMKYPGSVPARRAPPEIQSRTGVSPNATMISGTGIVGESAQLRRGFITQPRVARGALPWVCAPSKPPTLKGLPQRPDRSILAAKPQSSARILLHTVFSTKVPRCATPRYGGLRVCQPRSAYSGRADCCAAGGSTFSPSFFSSSLTRRNSSGNCCNAII